MIVQSVWQKSLGFLGKPVVLLPSKAELTSDAEVPAEAFGGRLRRQHHNRRLRRDPTWEKGGLTPTPHPKCLCTPNTPNIEPT